MSKPGRAANETSRQEHEMATARKALLKSVAGRRRAEGVAGDLADFVRTFKTLFDPYRPELHYMRGPGPAWHAKHDPAPAPSHTAPSHAVPALARVSSR